MKRLILILIFLSGLYSVAQTARVKGVILDEFNKPVENVTVKAGDSGTVSDATGFYQIEIPRTKKLH